LARIIRVRNKRTFWARNSLAKICAEWKSHSRATPLQASVDVIKNTIKILPFGGLPPAERAMRVSGGNPESIAARPSASVSEVELTGIVFLSPLQKRQPSDVTAWLNYSIQTS
jgi:hypothetical protein